MPLAFCSVSTRTACSLIRRQLRLVSVFRFVWVHGVPVKRIQLLEHLPKERRAQQVDLHQHT